MLTPTDVVEFNRLAEVVKHAAEVKEQKHQALFTARHEDSTADIALMSAETDLNLFVNRVVGLYGPAFVKSQ